MHPAAGRLALADAWRDEGDGARGAAARQRNAELRARRESRGDAGYHLDPYAVLRQKRDFLVRAAEDHRIAALQPHDDAMPARSIEQTLVDEVLGGRVTPAAL